VEPDICPIATLYSLYAYKGGRCKQCNYLSRGPSCSQFCHKIHWHGNRGWKGRNL